MTTKYIKEKIQGVFREVLDNETLDISEETVPSDIDGWDSLSHVVLMAALEEEFEIKFKIMELQVLANVGDMIQLVAEKTGKT